MPDRMLSNFPPRRSMCAWSFPSRCGRARREYLTAIGRPTEEKCRRETAKLKLLPMSFLSAFPLQIFFGRTYEPLARIFRRGKTGEKRKNMNDSYGDTETKTSNHTCTSGLWTATICGDFLTTQEALTLVTITILEEDEDDGDAVSRWPARSHCIWLGLFLLARTWPDGAPRWAGWPGGGGKLSQSSSAPVSFKWRWTSGEEEQI